MINRRNFLKKTSTALLSTPLLLNGGLSYASTDGKPLNIGIIGCGDRGGGLASILQNNQLLRVVACCDIIPFRLEKVATKNGSTPYTDYRALLDDPNVEAVIIASPFGLHDEMAIDAIQAGKHVYCEKTMAKGVNEIQSVLDAHRNSKLVFQVGYQYNSSALYKKVYEIIASGYIGEITAIECQWNRNGNWRREVPDPKWEKIINWRMYKEHSGGLVAELCSHQIDFICRTLKEFPKKIVGFGGIDHWKDGRETFDNVHLLYEFPGGVDASFTCTTTNGFENYEIRILGSKATILLDLRKATIHLEKNELKDYGIVDGVSGATRTAWEKGKGAPIEVDQIDPSKSALEQFYYAIREDKPVISDIESGAYASKCVQMSLDSLYEEKIAYWKDYPELRV